MESSVIANKGGTIRFDWPGNLVLYYQSKIRMTPPMNLHAAWQEISIDSFVNILDNVRTRTLSLALQIREEVGDISDLKSLGPQKVAVIERKVEINIYGGQTFMASDHASLNASSVTQSVVDIRDSSQLNQVLRSIGMTDVDLSDLTKAMKEDGPGKISSNLKAWIKEKASKVVTGGVKIGTDIGSRLLAAYLEKHYGLDSQS